MHGYTLHTEHGTLEDSLVHWSIHVFSMHRTKFEWILDITFTTMMTASRRHAPVFFHCYTQHGNTTVFNDWLVPTWSQTLTESHWGSLWLTLSCHIFSEGCPTLRTDEGHEPSLSCYTKTWQQPLAVEFGPLSEHQIKFHRLNSSVSDNLACSLSSCTQDREVEGFNDLSCWTRKAAFKYTSHPFFTESVITFFHLFKSLTAFPSQLGNARHYHSIWSWIILFLTCTKMINIHHTLRPTFPFAQWCMCKCNSWKGMSTRTN